MIGRFLSHLAFITLIAVIARAAGISRRSHL